MDVLPTGFEGVLTLVPRPFRDERGFFSRTFDSRSFDIAFVEHFGTHPAPFLQDSQSRSGRGVVRGLHVRGGAGEAKIVRCARGSAHVALVDARPGSPTFGERLELQLDDETLRSVYLPPHILIGFQALSAHVDICYRIDREHDDSESQAVRYDDPELGIRWPLPAVGLSRRDLEAGSWAEFCSGLLADEEPGGRAGAAVTAATGPTNSYRGRAHAPGSSSGGRP